MSESKGDTEPSIHPPGKIIAYTVLMTAVSVVLFLYWLDFMPSLADPNAAAEEELKDVFFKTTIIMFVAGVVGGSLFNFRGLVKHASTGNYKESFNLTYYFHPISGGISGLIVFFLLLGGAITLNIGGDNNSSWATFSGRMPFIAFALLAGYGSNAFMSKMKDLADTLFSPPGSNR